MVLLEGGDDLHRDGPADSITGVLVEDPVNAEKDSTELVLVDCRLEREGLLPPGTLDPLAIGRGTAELVRDEGDRDVLWPLANEAGEGLEARRAKGGVARRIGGEVGCEVGTGSAGGRRREGITAGRP